MKRIAWYTTLVLLTLTVLVLIWQFREAVILFLFSLVIAAAIYPLINYLTARKIPRGIALVASYVIVIGFIIGLIVLITGPLIQDIEQISNQLSAGYEKIHAAWLQNGSAFQKTLAGFIPPPADLFGKVGDGGGVVFFQGLMNTTTNFFGFLSSLGLVIILSLYWSADRLHFERLLLSLIPVDQRSKVRIIWRAVERGTGAYLRSELAQSLLAGFLLWIGYRLMGLNYPVLLAVVGAIAWLVPWFGAVIAMIPPFLVGLSNGLPLAIIASLYTVLILGLQEFFVEPRIFRRKSYNSFILVLVILALTDAFGFIGLLVAPLVSAVIQNIAKFLIQPPVTFDQAKPESSSVPVVTTEALRERLEKTKTAMADYDLTSSLSIESLVTRLDNLIDETENYLDGGASRH